MQVVDTNRSKASFTRLSNKRLKELERKRKPPKTKEKAPRERDALMGNRQGSSTRFGAAARRWLRWRVASRDGRDATRWLRHIPVFLWKCKEKSTSRARCFKGNRQRPILPGRVQPSTFGTGELNYCVRYGNRWDLSVITTGRGVFDPF